MLFFAFLPHFVIVECWRCRAGRNRGCCSDSVGALAAAEAARPPALRKQNPPFCLPRRRGQGGAGGLSLPPSPRQRPFRPALPPLPPSPAVRDGPGGAECVSPPRLRSPHAGAGPCARRGAGRADRAIAGAANGARPPRDSNGASRPMGALGGAGEGAGPCARP